MRISKHGATEMLNSTNIAICWPFVTNIYSSRTTNTACHMNDSHVIRSGHYHINCPRNRSSQRNHYKCKQLALVFLLFYGMVLFEINDFPRVYQCMISVISIIIGILIAFMKHSRFILLSSFDYGVAHQRDFNFDAYTQLL